MEIFDVIEWWWAARRDERAALCRAAGGSALDADYDEPDECVIQYVLNHPGAIGW